MSRKVKLAKIAKEIKQIKAQLNKTALTFQCDNRHYCDLYREFEQDWKKLSRSSFFEYSDFTLEAQKGKGTIEISFQVVGKVSDFYSGDPSIDPEDEFLSDIENDYQAIFDMSFHLNQPRPRDFDIEEDMYETTIYVDLTATVYL